MTKTEFVYKGIGNRAFTREFKLAEHMNVSLADLKNGVLSVDLELDIPEELKPRRISL
jgi:molecular chaperone IbpA